MRDSDLVMQILKTMDQNNKYICAMCAAPIALERAGLLQGKNYTAYLGYDKKIKEGTYLEDKVVVDGHLVTSRGRPQPMRLRISWSIFWAAIL